MWPIVDAAKERGVGVHRDILHASLAKGKDKRVGWGDWALPLGQDASPYGKPTCRYLSVFDVVRYRPGGKVS